MTDNNDTTYSQGIGFLGLLAIVFITLKLVGYINWSWWMVLAPVLWPFYVVIVCYSVAGGLELVSWALRKL